MNRNEESFKSPGNKTRKLAYMPLASHTTDKSSRRSDARAIFDTVRRAWIILAIATDPVYELSFAFAMPVLIEQLARRLSSQPVCLGSRGRCVLSFQGPFGWPITSSSASVAMYAGALARLLSIVLAWRWRRWGPSGSQISKKSIIGSLLMITCGLVIQSGRTGSKAIFLVTAISLTVCKAIHAGVLVLRNSLLPVLVELHPDSSWSHADPAFHGNQAARERSRRSLRGTLFTSLSTSSSAAGYLGSLVLIVSAFLLDALLPSLTFVQKASFMLIGSGLWWLVWSSIGAEMIKRHQGDFPRLQAFLPLTSLTDAWRQFQGDPSLFRYLICSGLVHGGYIMATSGLVAPTSTHRSLPSLALIAGLVIAPAWGLAGTLFFGQLQRITRLSNLAHLCLILAVSSMVPLLLATKSIASLESLPYWVFFALSAWYSFLGGAFFATDRAIVAELASPAENGEVFSFAAVFSRIGATFGTLCAALISDWTGLSTLGFASQILIAAFFLLPIAGITNMKAPSTQRPTLQKISGAGTPPIQVVFK